jgi:MFS family permease
MNGIFSNSSELVVYLLVTPFTGKIKRKLSTIICLLLMILCAVVMLCLSPRFVEQNSITSIINLVLSALILKGSTCFIYCYVYNFISEVFPTDIRATSNGIVLCIARCAGSAAPYFMVWFERMRLNKLAGSALLAPLALFFICFVKETLNKKIS